MVWAKLACSLHIPLPILVTLLEQTAAPCDPNKLTVWLKSEYKASQANHSHSQHGIVLSSPLYRLTNLASKHCAVNCLLLFCFIFCGSASQSGSQGFWKMHQAWLLMLLYLVQSSWQYCLCSGAHYLPQSIFLVEEIFAVWLALFLPSTKITVPCHNLRKIGMAP